MSTEIQLTKVPKDIKAIMENIKLAFSDHNYRLWLDCFDYKDDMSLSAEKDWFIGYVLNENLFGTKIDWQAIHFSKDEGIYRILCHINFNYTYYTDHNEWHEYSIKKNQISGQWRIYLIQKKRQAFTDFNETVVPYHFCKINMAYPAFDYRALIRKLSTIEDCGQTSLYARAIPRSIRYRKAHPAIECASLRANMLSPYIAKLVVEHYDTDLKKFAARIYNALRDSVMLSIERNDRDNSWASKFQASWQGIDELMETNVQNGKLTCSCSSYMSCLHSAFRLGGFTCDDVLQVRLKTQDILIVFIDKRPFLIDTERMIHVTDRVLFHYQKASVIYTDEWVWTEEGSTNLPADRRERIQQQMKMVQFLQFPFYVDNDIDVPNSAAPLDLCKVPPDFIEYDSDVLSQIILNYCHQPDSVDAWTLYAYQTLLVKKPEVYMYWSIQSKLVRQRASEMQKAKDIIGLLAQIEDTSIFAESHRIMTVDQVLRTGRGDHIAKALLTAAFFKLVTGCEAAVFLTTQKAYCVIHYENRLKCMEMPTGREISEISGMPLLLFNENANVWFELEEGKIFSLEKIFLDLKR